MFSRAQRVLATGDPELVEVNLLEDQGWESASICGGLLDIWIERFDAPVSSDFLRSARAAIERGVPAVAVTLIESPQPGLRGRRAVYALESGPTSPMSLDLQALPCRFADAALEAELMNALGGSALPQGSSGELLAGAAGSRFWVDSLLPQPELVIVGAGHVGAALAQMASLAGFSVVVLEDRANFANPERLPGVDRIVIGDPEIRLQELPLHPARHIVLVTRGHRMDARCLAVAAGLSTSYLGMIGSRRRVRRIVDELAQAGVSPDALASLHAPIGLPIGAETPGEIAVAILAEIIEQRQSR